MGKWKIFWLWFYRALLVVLLLGNLLLKDWVAELMVLALAFMHFAFQLDPHRNRGNKIAQTVLMLAGGAAGGAYLYFRYKGWR